MAYFVLMCYGHSISSPPTGFTYKYHPGDGRFLSTSLQVVGDGIWCRWDEELINLAQTWEPKQNGLCSVFFSLHLWMTSSTRIC